MKASAETRNKDARATAGYPFGDMPFLGQIVSWGEYPPPPDAESCMALWDKYDMLPNVRAHSTLVADIAWKLARRAAELGMPVDPAATRASGLLHDLAKTYCIRHGGSHALLGGAWVMSETRHGGIAQGVILHVHWPWPLPPGKAICSLPIFVLYADKRARHDACVPLRDRFEDLLVRYGHTELARSGIRSSYGQAREIEKALEEQLECNLHDNTFQEPLRSWCSVKCHQPRPRRERA